MDARRFFAEFEHITSAPNGVQQVRGSILQLAICGELIQIQESAETVQALIVEISTRREQLLGQNKIKKQPSLPQVDVSDLNFELPTTWAVECLGNICEIVRGVNAVKPIFCG